MIPRANLETKSEHQNLKQEIGNNPRNFEVLIPKISQNWILGLIFAFFYMFCFPLIDGPVPRVGLLESRPEVKALLQDQLRREKPLAEVGRKELTQGDLISVGNKTRTRGYLESYDYVIINVYKLTINRITDIFLTFNCRASSFVQLMYLHQSTESSTSHRCVLDIT